MEKIIELVNELNKASELYYNGQESFLTDSEFDKKLDELTYLENKYNLIYANSPTITVGSKVLSQLNKISIKDKPMLSLDKVHTEQEIIDFSDGYDVIASIKCDGLSIRLIYKDGYLVSANTRGDGYEGADVTEHIKQFLNVPLMIEKQGKYIVDGEAIIYDSDFAIVNKNGQFKNSRNTASGSLSLLDTKEVKNRRLSFILWDVIEGGNYDLFHYNIEEAQELGFTVVPMMALDCTKVEKEEIKMLNDNLLSIAKNKGIPCDGIVWKINDIKAGEKKGRTEHHFLNAIAWKPKDDEYETKLLKIELSIGRTGVITPIAVFEPIDINKSTIERASLHNISVLEETLGQYPEYLQKIWVAKANQIIPQITRAEKNNDPHDHCIFFKDNVFCPVCGERLLSSTSVSGVESLICPNDKCDGKIINKIEHYCSKNHGLDIKGISKATIGKLIDWGFVNELKDIYNLEQYRNEWESKPGFGKASVGKILDAVSTTGRFTQLDAFISAIGIPLVGRAIAKEIVKYYDTWEDFRAAVGSDWTVFDGFGPEISNAINSFDYTEFDEISGWLEFKQPEVQQTDEGAAAIKDKVFVITGKLRSYKNRDELKTEIESLGGKITGSISSKTNYLISNDKTSTTAKTKKAKSLGVKIISEEEYKKLTEK